MLQNASDKISIASETKNKEAIIVVTPLVPTYSETFLNVHIDKLPFEIHHLHSSPGMGYFPIYFPEMQPLFSDNKWLNILEFGIDKLLGEKSKGYLLRKSRLYKYIKQNNIRLILAEYGPVGAYLTPLAKKIGIPLVTHFHGRDAYHYKTLKRFKNQYREMFEYASAVVPVSNDMKKQLHKIGCPEEKMMVNHYGPNLDYFQFNDIAGNDIKFITVGRFTDKKAPHLVIRAFNKVLKELPQARLTMIADGPLWESSKVLAGELEISDKIDFPGPLPPEEIQKAFKESLIFVQHSVRASDGDSEGTPNAVLEAMAAGLPVISTRHAGIKDVVVEGKTGLLSDEYDYETMADQMIQLGKDRPLCMDMGKKGCQRVQEHFTMESHINRLTEIINKSINN